MTADVGRTEKLKLSINQSINQSGCKVVPAHHEGDVRERGREKAARPTFLCFGVWQLCKQWFSSLHPNGKGMRKTAGGLACVLFSPDEDCKSFLILLFIQFC